ncbi:unnamed protein product, partial [Rotaria sp. Silwood1]
PKYSVLDRRDMDQEIHSSISSLSL